MQKSFLIIGAGPAGLTAAHELLKYQKKPIVLEQCQHVGGISRTEIYKGYRFDIGGHRFYTKNQEINKLWHDMLGPAFGTVKRLSRIYYNQHYFHYPLKLGNTLKNLGFVESARILISYLLVKLWPCHEETTFEHWVINRFGRRLYDTFFKVYTEKVWGIPCDQIQAEWAAQRIKGLSFKSVIMNALGNGTQNAHTLIDEFHYPQLGPGMMWEAFQTQIQQAGGQVQLGTRAKRIRHEAHRIKHVIAHNGTETIELPVEQLISTLPISELIKQLDPAPPFEVLQAAHGLKYRAFVLVGLILDKADIFPDNWIYIHDPSVKVGRIQNFKNWSPNMVADPNKTSLGMEYFCDEGDEIWTQSDEKLIALAMQEVCQLGFICTDKIEAGYVIRQPKAYPVYDAQYQKHLQIIQDFLTPFDNLQTIGRNGMHRYNNMDHSMLMGLLAARNIMGEKNDLWRENTDQAYYEDMELALDITASNQ
jgi:protoporphyrinogen oxidase